MSEETFQTDSRLGRAVVALRDVLHGSRGSGVLSAKDLAAAAGVPVNETGMLADELRGLGVELDGSAASGFRLTSEADVALPEVLEPEIAGTVFAGGVRHYAKIGSTSTMAMKGGAEGVAEGAVWLAEEQTAGKGRAGHTWESNPRDGIYCSALLRPRLAPADVIILSLAAGLAVVDAVHEVTGLWGDLRWPNDVMLGGKKFCGILTELNAEVTKVRYVVVGMGINVNQMEFPAELESIATSLRIAAGRRFARVPLVAALLRALDREQSALHHGIGGAKESILRRFEQHSSYCCDRVVWVEEDGGYEGVTRGLDDRGFLKVETAQGMRTVLSGGVRER